MVNYICPRCNYTTYDKTKYVNHLKRKIICNPILSKTNLQKEYIKYNIIDKIQMNPKESIFVNSVKRIIQLVVI